MTELRTHRLSKARPFPGLRPFGFEDHEFFFGREDQTFALYRLIDRSRFVTVVGSSGSGKSSLVRAGLQPLIDQETMGTGGRVWLQAEMRPGDAPLQRLTDALAGLAKGDDKVVHAARRERIAFHLRDSYGVEEALSEIKTVGDAAVLLIVDQFEELFRYIAFPRRSPREEANTRDEAVRFVQILLQASRSRVRNVHVLLTMRSDFIGDCARFQGLPEAVSAAQFLVPSLTRDQLEEVIRKPVEYAGAAVESTLVNTLINDSNDEPDQLPVLQHCLLRMWECAGTEAGLAQSAAPLAATENGSADRALPARTLTITHYDKIGRVAEALSRHADDILGELKGHEMAVEQVFRALAEVDKEGRATRRALKFSQLLAETGIAEDELRLVVNRYRDDDCSFLVPGQSATPKLEAATRIDVGHEALLRRWRRVSGDPDAPLDYGVEDNRAAGWLNAEQLDAKQYRDLLGRLEDGSLPLKKFDRRLKWWRSRPRTAAWSQRYGGRLTEVEGLFENTIARRKRNRRYAAVSTAAVIAIVSVAGWYGKKYRDEHNQLVVASGLATHAAEHNLHAAEHNFVVVAQSTKWLLDTVLASLRNDKIPKETARLLLGAAEKAVADANPMNNNPELDMIAVDLAVTESDIEITLNDKESALLKVRAAKSKAEGLALAADKNPDRKKAAATQQLVYRTAFRIGDVLAEKIRDNALWERNLAAALREYNQAHDIVVKLAQEFPTEASYVADVIFITGKIGEALELQLKIPEALARFRLAKEIAEKFVAANPSDGERSRLLAATRTKIGKALTELNPPDRDGALAEYDAAMKLQKRLVEEGPNDTARRSNLAITLRARADLRASRQDFNGAFEDYLACIDIREKLAKADPSDMRWQTYLAPTYASYGTALAKAGQTAAASEQYRKEVDTRRILAQKAPADQDLENGLRASEKRLAELTKSEAAAAQPTGSVKSP